MSQDREEEEGYEIVFPLQAASGRETYNLFAEVLRTGTSLRVKVTGRSMIPFLRGGEFLTIRKVSSSRLRVGDLIFFKNREGSPVLHRIVRKNNSAGEDMAFHTKGDALYTCDDPVRGYDILGKVFSIEKSAKGRTKHIDMESFLWSKINYFLALVSLFRLKVYSLIS
jgi:signal peptidase I